MTYFLIYCQKHPLCCMTICTGQLTSVVPYQLPTIYLFMYHICIQYATLQIYMPCVALCHLIILAHNINCCINRMKLKDGFLKFIINKGKPLTVDETYQMECYLINYFAF